MKQSQLMYLFISIFRQRLPQNRGVRLLLMNRHQCIAVQFILVFPVYILQKPVLGPHQHMTGLIVGRFSHDVTGQLVGADVMAHLIRRREGRQYTQKQAAEE